MASIQKGQSYPDLGFRIDSKGVAYDLATGKGLPKSEVDARLSGTGMTQLAKKRGGLAGIYDRNKAAIPIAQTALAMLPGIGPLASAAIGGLRGFDREGKGGIGFDVGQGLKGAATGYAAGMTGDALGGALGKAASAAGAAGGVKSLPGITAAGKSLASSALGNLGGIGDFLTGNNGLNALGVAQGVNAALLNQKAIQYAKDAEGTAMSAWNKNAPLRDAGRAGMLAPKPSVDTSFLPGIRRAGNPFAK